MDNIELNRKLYKYYRSNAMLSAEKGDIFSKKCNLIKAKIYYKVAFEYEKKAAMLLIEDKKEYARTRAVVFRSAAILALEADLFEECENMVFEAIKSHFIPEYLTYELKDILKKIKK